MSLSTRRLPPGAVNCRAGDYLVKQSGDSVWQVFEVEELIGIDRLFPIGDRDATEFIEERHARDSEPAMGRDEEDVRFARSGARGD
jgi:hypothetical protein